MPEELKRTANQEEITPLVELCKAGRLFAVQEWIASGKPVNPPPVPIRGKRPKSPLAIAINRGFHSLVQVLLQGGAVQEPQGRDTPMSQAIEARRMDLVELLVEHGFDPAGVDMRDVFESWDPQIIGFFIARGGNVREDNPFAYAFCNRVRTALRFFKECRVREPDLQEQANIAARRHCKEGNLKSVSLMLWAGADPFKPGVEDPDEELTEDDDGLSALGFAALYDHFEVFDLKPVRAQETNPGMALIFKYLTHGDGLAVLKRVLEKGLNPNDDDNGGCSGIRSCLDQMSSPWQSRRDPWDHDSDRRLIDTPAARESLKAIHLLAKHGAKWIPEDESEVSSVRRSLLRLVPDYTIEVVWIFSNYQACTAESIRNLLRSSSIRRHTSAHRSRLEELLASWK